MDDLLIKYLLGEASPEEVIRVGEWLAADAANRARYEQFKAVWEGSGRAVPGGARDTGLAWQEMQGRLRERGVVRKLWVGRLAAVLVGILTLGPVLYSVLLSHRTGRPPGTVVAVSPAQVADSPAPVKPSGTAGTGWRKFFAGDSTLTDILPDQSVVTLNRRSTFSYRVREADSGLTVNLQGEGFFSVTHHPSRPFVVEVNDLTITVLGTSFELKASGGDSGVLIVETGAVEVRGGKDSKVLHAGERLSWTNGKISKKEPNRDQLYGYYLGRPLICDSTPLRRIVEVLNEKYDTHIVLGRPELGDLLLTTVFRQESPDRILGVIAATFKLSVVRQGQLIIIR